MERKDAQNHILNPRATSGIGITVLNRPFCSNRFGIASILKLRPEQRAWSTAAAAASTPIAVETASDKIYA